MSTLTTYTLDDIKYYLLDRMKTDKVWCKTELELEELAEIFGDWIYSWTADREAILQDEYNTLLVTCKALKSDYHATLEKYDRLKEGITSFVESIEP